MGRYSDIDKKVYDRIKEGGVNFVVSVPCKFLAGLISLVEDDKEIIHIPVTREEEGIGICVGAFLGGMKPAIFMQNSGLGNSLNAIMSLVNLYGIPIVFIISHRGVEGERFIAQKPMGSITKDILNIADILWIEMKDQRGIPEIPRIIKIAWKREKPVAILFPIKFWGGQANKKGDKA